MNTEESKEKTKELSPDAVCVTAPPRLGGLNFLMNSLDEKTSRESDSRNRLNSDNSAREPPKLKVNTSEEPNKLMRT